MLKILIVFNHDETLSNLSAVLEDKHIVAAKEYYLALQGGNVWKDLIEDIETGDNFRLGALWRYWAWNRKGVGMWTDKEN